MRLVMNIFKRFLTAITMLHKEVPKPEKEKCEHDWHRAGPKRNKRELLESISGLDIRDRRLASDPYPLKGVILYDGRRTYKFEVRVGEVLHWVVDEEIQGSVCLICGECIDAIQKEIDYWENEIVERAKRDRIADENYKLANKIWEDSSCNDN